MTKIDYKTYQKPSNFAKLSLGDNQILIVSDGIMCYEHGMVSGGQYIPLGTCSETIDCEQCKKGYEAKLRYKWVVYLPEINDVRVLSVGPKTGDEICQIAIKEGVRNFELVINRSGIGKQTRYKINKVELSKIDEKTLIFIKKKKDYLYQKYLSK